jgi:hypothetical protein
MAAEMVTFDGPSSGVAWPALMLRRKTASRQLPKMQSYANMEIRILMILEMADKVSWAREAGRQV